MIKHFIGIIVCIIFASNISSAAYSPVVLKAAEKELKRSMTELGTHDNPPFFISYSITDRETNSLYAQFGKLIQNVSNKKRILDLDLRVGSYKFDNTHIIRGNAFNFGGGARSTVLPMDNNEKAIRSAIWYATDISFKKATEVYEKALTNQAVKVQMEDTSADFSRENPSVYSGKYKTFTLNKAKWEKIIKRLSTKFSDHPLIYNASVSMRTEILHKYFVSSEGSKVKLSETAARIMVQAKTKSDDGMSLPLHKSYFAFEPENLPKEEDIAKDIDKMISLLSDLRKAPLAETFSGPAILSGPASGVFFHEIFGHRVEGHREKDPNSAQIFKQSIGKEILPKFLHVVFDPTIKTMRNQLLSGFYEYDDEGVKSQKVKVVENGIFKNFLMNRSPIENFAKSNGHGRKQSGNSAVSRQSNLLVLTDKPVSENELKEEMRKLCKEQKKDYGLYFDAVSGGFTFTSRTLPNAFNVTPLVVYKIYADGRPDELVRGVDLIGTPLTTFANIVLAADDFGVFNGMCGAESGSVPVSACSPSLLVSTIEVQKKKKSQAKPPLLSAPKLRKQTP